MGLADVRKVVAKLGLLQFDSVNVVARAHHQVLFSRLGAFDIDLLDALVARGEITEQWAHEACFVPITTWPLLAHRREEFRVRPRHFAAFLEKHPGYLDEVLEAVESRGALTADELHVPEGAERRLESSWVGTASRAALETHFGRGNLAIVERRKGLVRAYDLPSRVVPSHLRELSVPRQEAERALLDQAGRAHGVGTAADLADYFRMSRAAARPRIDELVEAKRLLEVEVEGFREKAYLHAEARVPRRIDARALLSPFDPVVWFRPRTRRLFAFDYRFEIFIPDEKRKWGTYVLPFLLGESLVARVDLKADRGAGRLRILAAHREVGPGLPADATIAEALAAELHALAAWMGLEVAVPGRGAWGGFIRPLASALTR